MGKILGYLQTYSGNKKVRIGNELSERKNIKRRVNRECVSSPDLLSL